jgi:hydroxyacylglutathione hydrolase
VVHCVSGDRSSIAASLLLSKGFKNVINLTGGYSNWANNGFKIEREENLVVA